MNTLANTPEPAANARLRTEPAAPPTVELELILDPTLGTGPVPSRAEREGWQERLVLLTDLAAQRLAEDPDVVLVALIATGTGGGSPLHLRLECALATGAATLRVSDRVETVLIPDLEEQLGESFTERELIFTVA